jgi:hypothetical protein
VPTAEVPHASGRAATGARPSWGRRVALILVVALALGGGALAAWHWRAGTGPLAAARDAGTAPPSAPAVTADAQVPSSAASRPAPADAAPVASSTPSAPKPAPVAAAPVGTLVVRVDVPNATVTVDGVTVARATEVVRVPVKRAGEHVVIVTAPGRPRQKRKVVVAAGAEVEVSLHLAPGAAGKRRPAARADASVGKPTTGGEPGKASGPTGAASPPLKVPRKDDGDGTIDPFKRPKP